MRRLILTGLLLVSSSSFAATELRDYAYQAEIDFVAQPLQRIELPLEIVLQLTQSDLADIAVFNRNGQALPHAIAIARGETLDHQRSLSFHEFSQFQREHSKTVTTREQNQQEGTISELQTTQTVSVQSERPVYLVELSSGDDAPDFERLELRWTHEPASQVLSLKVEVGNDLNSMRVIKKTTNLTNQHSDDPSWRSIRGIPRQQKYLRLTPDASVSHFEIHEVTGFWEENQPVADLAHRIDTESTRHDDGEYYYFKIPSAVNPHSVRIIPADAHSIVSGDLYASRDDFDKRYRLHRNFRQHNIEGSEVKPSKPIDLHQRQIESAWIKLSHEVSAAPTVELSYLPHELIFLGDGKGPYHLAWGNHEARGNQNRLTEVLKDSLPEAQRRGIPVTLHLVQDAGGEDRLTPEPKLPWQKWVLWALLIVAAAIALRMALSLYREMNGESVNG